MLKKPRIAIFHCGFIYSGGGERIVLEEARGLIKRGYKVDIFAPTVDPSRCFPELLRELNVRPFLSTYLKNLPLRNAIRMVACSFLAPIMALGYKKYDIFIGANQPGAWIAFCMARVLGKPYVVYLNQPNRIVYPRPVDVEFGWATTEKDYHFLYRFFAILKPVMRALDAYSVTNASKILANGKYIGEVIENIYSKWVIDAPAGAKANGLKSTITDMDKIFKGNLKVGNNLISKPYLLITNRHDPQKRFDYVLHAFTLILKLYPNLNLAIPGPLTQHSRKLIHLTEKLKIKDKVIFTGQIAEKNLQELYKNAAVYCYPSPDEDFGLGPLEAGGWGVPTVAWDHAGPTITVENGVSGFLAKPYNVRDYADNIIKILNSKTLRKKMGLAAWRRTQKIFSWKNHIDTLEKNLMDAL